LGDFAFGLLGSKWRWLVSGETPTALDFFETAGGEISLMDFFEIAGETSFTLVLLCIEIYLLTF